MASLIKLQTKALTKKNAKAPTWYQRFCMVVFSIIAIRPRGAGINIKKAKKFCMNII